MDWRSKAAGEQEDETSQKRTSSNGESVTPEYCLGIVRWLETFTGKTLPENQVELWMERLSLYPKWKLMKLTSYTGGLTNEVYRYLDDLRRPDEKPAYLKGLPEPKTDVAKRTIAFLDALFGKVSEEEKDRAEREWVAFMQGRGHKVWCQRQASKEVMA